MASTVFERKNKAAETAIRAAGRYTMVIDEYFCLVCGIDVVGVDVVDDFCSPFVMV